MAVRFIAKQQHLAQFAERDYKDTTFFWHLQIIPYFFAQKVHFYPPNP